VVPSSRRGRETILLVEDDDSGQVVARSILRKNGYNVIEARIAGERSSSASSTPDEFTCS